MFAVACLQLAEKIAATLQNSLNIDLSSFVRGELNLSDSDYDKLRLSFCKRYDPARCAWVKRPWNVCSVLGKSTSMPQPLLSRHKLPSTLTAYSEEQGLALSYNGKVCERSLFESARKLIERDCALLSDPVCDVWYLPFDVDATAISSKRYFLHALLSVAAMYQRSKATLSELMALTLAIAQHKDDACGLLKVPHVKDNVAGKDGKGVTCLAMKIEQLYFSPYLELLDGSSVRVGIRCCLDLATVRGMRGVWGKEAALCGCQGKEGMQMVPGEDWISPISDADDLATWINAECILKENCCFGSAVMEYDSLLSAAHIPADD
eukprot:2106370-Pleurochrysis_carterae.AAC.4